MARIKIKDLPKDKKISDEEMKRVRGGLSRGFSIPYLKFRTFSPSGALFGPGLYMEEEEEEIQA